MSRIFNVDNKEKKIATLNVEGASKLIFNEESETVLVNENGGKSIPSCINCLNPRCMTLLDIDFRCSTFPDMSPNVHIAVCPIDAISAKSDSIDIDERKCIGCGLCVERCPVGALYIHNGKATLNKTEKKSRNVMPINKDNASVQARCIEEMTKVPKTGYIREENDEILATIYRRIKHMDQEKQNMLARNLMISLSNKAMLSRQGNVYLRMDGFYENKKQYGVMEIETGSDMLDVSRAILDDVAMINARFDVLKDGNHPLAICLGLPNRRTDYWQVVKDIKNIVDLRINTVSFGALLLLHWNFKAVRDFDIFYVDIDNSSIRKSTEKLLGREIDISKGYLGVLENGK